MTVGIVGLGLIGGSLANAYHEHGHKVLAADANASVAEFAKLSGVVDEYLTKDNMRDCELILIAIYPEAAVKFMEENAPYINKESFVIDCCGTKRLVCEAGFRLAKEYGYTYVGGHPMAGTHHSGFAASRSDLFHGACMVIVPDHYDDINFFEHIKELISPAGFGSISVTTAEKHDEIIAFTSQLAHVVSNAYIKSPTAREHRGFSAGSYKDLTRVAWLNPDMWTDLFIANGDCLVPEIDCIINELTKYRNAITEHDAGTLRALLDEGRRIKEEVDGK